MLVHREWLLFSIIMSFYRMASESSDCSRYRPQNTDTSCSCDSQISGEACVLKLIIMHSSHIYNAILILYIGCKYTAASKTSAEQMRLLPAAMVMIAIFFAQTKEVAGTVQLFAHRMPTAQCIVDQEIECVKISLLIQIMLLVINAMERRVHYLQTCTHWNRPLIRRIIHRCNHQLIRQHINRQRNQPVIQLTILPMVQHQIRPTIRPATQLIIQL